MPDEPKPGEEVTNPDRSVTKTVDYKALLLALLSLPDTATDEEIAAKETEVRGTLGGVGDLQTKASSAEELQRQYDELQKQYQELNTKQEEIWKQKKEAEADEILKVYESHFADDASKAAIRNILINDKEAGILILNGLKKPEAVAPAEETPTTDTPPSPKHDTAATDDAKVAADRADKISARAKQIVKESGNKISLTKAYQQAEHELDQAATA
jgi:hypothetical protein